MAKHKAEVFMLTGLTGKRGKHEKGCEARHAIPSATPCGERVHFVNVNGWVYCKAHFMRGDQML